MARVPRNQSRNKSSKDVTSLMVPRPSFWEGVARLFDFSNALSSYSPALTSTYGDYIALSSDWYAIGHDMQNAIDLVTHGNGANNVS